MLEMVASGVTDNTPDGARRKSRKPIDSDLKVGAEVIAEDGLV